MSFCADRAYFSLKNKHTHKLQVAVGEKIAIALSRRTHRGQ